jgi:hypothetical protein
MDPTQTPNQNPSAAMMLGSPQTGQPSAPGAAALGTPPAVATPSPQPSAPAAPAAATTQAPQQPATPAQPQPAPSPAQQVAAAQNAHHAVLGRLARYLLGSENQYQVNPQTGQVDATPVQRKPGDIFRSVVTGAILGMAAGSQSHDFAGGFGQGGAAAIQQQQNQDQQRYARAQQQQAAQQKQRAFDLEKQSHDAAVAQQNANNLRLDWEMGLNSQRFLDEHNDRERAFQLQLDQMGATPMKIPSGGEDINDQVGNGKALQKLVGQDLDAVKAPDGYHTLHTMSVDTSGLSFKGGQWVDSDGDPVNIEDRATHTLYQLPDSLWNQRADGIRTGADLNKIVGFQLVDPTRPLGQVTVGDVMAARTKGQELALKNSEAGLDAAKAAKALRGANVKPSNDPSVNMVANALLSSHATTDDVEQVLDSSSLSDTQKNEVRKMYKQLQPKPQGSAVDRAIAQLSGGTATAPTTPPPGKAVLYDPQGNPHAVDSKLLNQYLSSPQYKGWHK